jgi:hypothetical protein
LYIGCIYHQQSQRNEKKYDGYPGFHKKSV